MEILHDDVELCWPEDNSTEEVLNALRGDDQIRKLVFDFDDEDWNTSKELRDTLIAVINSYEGEQFIFSFQVYNNCDNPVNRKQCLDLFLDYIRCTSNSIGHISYLDLGTPWTLAEAQKIASTIACRNEPHEFIQDLELIGNLFSDKGTFECVFNAVLDTNIWEFLANSESLFDLNCGCIERSTLATNETLERLTLTLWQDDVFVADEGVEQIANALKTNQGLQHLHFARGLITNLGRLKLLESLRENKSLVELDTAIEPGAVIGSTISVDNLLRLEGGIEGRELQSKINKHMKLNKVWKNMEDLKHCRPITSHKIYPDVLEVLAKKPLLLHTFLRERDHPQLFGSFYIRSLSHRTRRRSERLLKKRRVTAPGNAY